MAGSITILGITIPLYLIARSIPSFWMEFEPWAKKRFDDLSRWWSDRHKDLPRHGGGA